jgi:hypothetical protein
MIYTQTYSEIIRNCGKYKESLKIPKGLSKIVNRRRTENAMAKRTTNIPQNTTLKKAKD